VIVAHITFAKTHHAYYNMHMRFGLQIIQVISAVLLMALILIQSKGVGLGSTFGGGGEVYYTRRGAEKFIFWGTIFVAIVFTLSSLAGVLLTK